MAGRPRKYASHAERQAAYEERKKNLTKFNQRVNFVSGEVDRLAIVHLLRDGGVEMTESKVEGGLYFIRTENFPYAGIKPWLEEETEKRAWQSRMQKHIQGLLEPTGLKFRIFPSAKVHESCLVIAIWLS